MNLSSINLRFFANIAPLVSGLNKAERAMDRAGKKMQAVGKNLTMKVTAPIVGLGAVAVNTFQGFELQMAKVKAVSGATGAEFEALSKNAKDLGASTIFSAKQVAELQTEFAKLGFTAAEITQVTEATLALAQATDSDLARAAEVAGSTLRAFQLDASETERVTDVMAKSFSTSALDMETFAESMKYVAPVAKSAGMSIEETTAMLSVMANAGIKGSQAGTSLRRIISELGTGSEPVAEKIKQLANAGIGLADAKDEVGRSAQSALLVLAGGVDQIDPTTKSLEGAAGAAKEMASIMDNTGSGSMKALQSAFEGLMISIGEIIATGFTPFIKVLTSVVQGINAMPGPLKAVVVVIAALAAAAGPLIFIAGGLYRNFVVLAPVLMKVGAAMRFIAIQGLRAMISPIGAVVAGIAALSAAAIYVGYNFKAFKVTALNALKGLANVGIGILNSLIERFNAIAGLLGFETISIAPIKKFTMEIVPAFKSIGQVADELKKDLGSLFGGEAAKTAGVSGGVIEQGGEVTEEATDKIVKGAGAATGALNRMANAGSKSMGSMVVAMTAASDKIKRQFIQPMSDGQIAVGLAAFDMSNNITQAINAAAVSFIGGFGEMLGAMAVGGASMADLGTFVLQSFAGLLTQLGNIAIETGIALLGIKAAIQSLNPVLAIAGGVALLALAGAVKGSLAKTADANIPMMAEGGIVTGPTLAMIGEGRGPEAVIPLDKLDGFMGGGGAQNINVTGRIQGSDILLSQERATRERSRYRGY
jgi:hypothetical protein